jgi:hypothetical protein
MQPNEFNSINRIKNFELLFQFSLQVELEKHIAHISREDESKDDMDEKSAALSMDADYSGHCHVWNVAMLVSLDTIQGCCWLVLAAINNYGAVVKCHDSKLESCSAGQLAIHDGQGKQGLFLQVRCTRRT